LTASTIVTGEDGANKSDAPCTTMPGRATRGDRARGRAEAACAIGRHLYRSAAARRIETRRTPPISGRGRPSGRPPRHGELDPRCPSWSVPIV
jgi:hypothetical protein